jgi:hypothetical protein
MGGGKGGSRGPSWEQQTQFQRDMQREALEAQKQMQLEAEERLRVQREQEKEEEAERRQEAALAKEEELRAQEEQEAAVFAEMTGQVGEETDSEGMGFNLDAPTIERPEYEQETRPE